MVDGYGSVGPEKPDYELDVERVAKQLGRAGVVDVPFAARNTLKHVVLVLLPAARELRSADAPLYTVRPHGFTEQPGIFVALDNGKAAWLPATGDLHPSYVQGYLGHPYGAEEDGSDALTTFINSVASYIYGAALAAEAAGVR